jgi:hypothetical protein
VGLIHLARGVIVAFGLGSPYSFKKSIDSKCRSGRNQRWLEDEEIAWLAARERSRS